MFVSVVSDVSVVSLVSIVLANINLSSLVRNGLHPDKHIPALQSRR